MTTAQQEEIIERIDTLETAVRQLVGMLNPKENRGEVYEFTALEAVTAAARYYGINPEDVYRKLRKREIAHSRHLAAWLLREVHGASWTLQRIGAALRVDHTTIIYAVESAGNRIEADDALRKYARNIVENVTRKEIVE